MIETAVAPQVSRDAAPRAMLPVVFGPSGRELMGFYHAPAGHLRSPGVVLCNPPGFEAMSVHRTFRHLADRLASRGFPALRFDYDGTGDSSGRAEDPGRFRAWVASIHAAVAEIRARSGVQHVALFGAGFGATLAAVATAELSDIESLICWAPVVSGRSHVRELRAFRLIRASNVPKRTDGSEEVGGYFYSRETLEEMAAVDLLACPDRVTRRVLILRSDRPGDESRLVEKLTASGADVRLISETGYSRMIRDDPYESVVPFPTLDSIVEWLSEKAPGDRRAAPAVKPATKTLTLRASDGKTVLRETPVVFGEGQRLFGIMTEPDGPIGADRPALLFLNVGANHHVGPHRMNVGLAREVASLGYLTLRFDAAGLGESRVAPGVHENRIYTKDAVSDVKAAMDLLGQLRDVRSFVLVGLCSGAYVAFHTAVEDARVVGQALLSPYAFEWKEGDPVAPTLRKGSQGGPEARVQEQYPAYLSTRFYARALRDHRVWLRALRGEVDIRGIGGTLLARLRTSLGLGLRSLGRFLQGHRGPQNEVERAFVAMSDRGVETLMVLTFEDGGNDMVAQYLGTDARRMRRRKNFRFEMVEGSDHSFRSLASQATLRGILSGFVTGRFPLQR